MLILGVLDCQCDDCNLQQVEVRTPFGPLHIQIVGDQRLPAIFTYHDIGLNSRLQ